METEKRNIAMRKLKLLDKYLEENKLDPEALRWIDPQLYKAGKNLREAIKVSKRTRLPVQKNLRNKERVVRCIRASDERKRVCALCLNVEVGAGEFWCTACREGSKLRVIQTPARARL